jgi:hypothetical protein
LFRVRYCVQETKYVNGPTLWRISKEIIAEVCCCKHGNMFFVTIMKKITRKSLS